MDFLPTFFFDGNFSRTATSSGLLVRKCLVVTKLPTLKKNFGIGFEMQHSFAIELFLHGFLKLLRVSPILSLERVSWLSLYVTKAAFAAGVSSVLAA